MELNPYLFPNSTTWYSVYEYISYHDIKSLETYVQEMFRDEITLYKSPYIGLADKIYTVKNPDPYALLVAEIECYKAFSPLYQLAHVLYFVSHEQMSRFRESAIREEVDLSYQRFEVMEDVITKFNLKNGLKRTSFKDPVHYILPPDSPSNYTAYINLLRILNPFINVAIEGTHLRVISYGEHRLHEMEGLNIENIEGATCGPFYGDYRPESTGITITLDQMPCSPFCVGHKILSLYAFLADLNRPLTATEIDEQGDIIVSYLADRLKAYK